jgi:hypothetical protein
MASYSTTTVKKLFGRAGNRCAFPDCNETIIHSSGHIAGEICHIRARSQGGPRFNAAQTDAQRNGYENLIILCSNHHKVIDAKPDVYTVEILIEMKALAESKFAKSPQSTDSIYALMLMSHSLPVLQIAGGANVAINSPNSIQTNIFNIKQARKLISINAPPDSSGANGNAARYIEHLIGRYNEFAKSEPTRSRAFSFGAIRKNIENEFGTPWKYVPISRFEELCDYLKGRITRTRISKINDKRGVKSFSSFEDFTQKTSGIRQE